MSSEEIVRRVVTEGDLTRLTAAERVQYYSKTCESLGLNPLTQPFEFIQLNGKLRLYARRDATDQLRKIHRVSLAIVARERTDDLYVVTARATTPEGRVDESIGAVPLTGKKGEDLANALMKAETKAKRRVTLAIVGLGFLDESEVESITAAEEPAPPVPALPAPKLGYVDAIREIEAATSAGRLKVLAAQIRGGDFDEGQRAELTAHFAAKRASFAA